MIEIRPAKPDELLRQKELWKLAFGDEDDYIDYFFAHGEESQVLVLLEDGVVYTMVALFPVAIALPGGRTASSAYIYALATHPDARKKGFGRYILSYVDFYLKERGADCVTSVPAEVSLHKFFGTTGFSECFTSASKLFNVISNITNSSFSDCRAPAAPAVRSSRGWPSGGPAPRGSP